MPREDKYDPWVEPRVPESRRRIIVSGALVVAFTATVWLVASSAGGITENLKLILIPAAAAGLAVFLLQTLHNRSSALREVPEQMAFPIALVGGVTIYLIVKLLGDDLGRTAVVLLSATVGTWVSVFIYQWIFLARALRGGESRS